MARRQHKIASVADLIELSSRQGHGVEAGRLRTLTDERDLAMHHPEDLATAVVAHAAKVLAVVGIYWWHVAACQVSCESALHEPLSRLARRVHPFCDGQPELR